MARASKKAEVTTIKLGAEDAKKFVDAINDPPPMNDALKRAFKKRDELVSDGFRVLTDDDCKRFYEALDAGAKPTEAMDSAIGNREPVVQVEKKKTKPRTKERLDRVYPAKLSEKEREASEAVRFGKYNPTIAKSIIGRHREAIKKAKAEAVERVWEIDGKPANRYEVMEYLVTMVSEGVRLPQLCDQEGMPMLIEVRSWFKRHPDFKTKLEEAKEALAERYVDQAHTVLQEADSDRTGLAKAESELCMKMAGMMSEEFKEKKIIQTEDISHTWTEAQILARMRVLTDSDPNLKEEFKKLISSNIIDAEICDESGDAETTGIDQLEDRGSEQNG